MAFECPIKEVWSNSTRRVAPRTALSGIPVVSNNTFICTKSGATPTAPPVTKFYGFVA